MPHTSTSRNIELKARLADAATARETAERLATAHLGVERQRDTYFACPKGRLKLREIEGRSAELIAYERALHSAPKASDYCLVELPDPDTALRLRRILELALGSWIVVDKTREIYLYRNVRIHFDQVRDLGTFLEFEAAVQDAIDDDAAYQQLAWLRSRFGIADTDLIAESYSDMLLSIAQSR